MNSRVPEISVILPVYNGAAYIRESIQSLLAQSFTEWELIVFDAASTDRTLAVLDQLWVDQPILQTKGRIIRSSVRDNLPRSLNLAFAQAQGRLVTWTSDDNRYLPNALEVLRESLKSRPDCGVVYAHSYQIDAHGNRFGKLRSLSPEHLVYGNNIGLSFLYRREVHEAIQGYDENQFLVEDYDFWMRASERFKFLHVDRFLYEIRYHGQSLTENNREKTSILAENVFERDLVGMKTWLPAEWQIRGHLRLAWTGLRQGNYGRVFRNLGQSLRISLAVSMREGMRKAVRSVVRSTRS